MYSNFNILGRPLLFVSLILISFIVCQSDLSPVQFKEPFQLLKLDKNYYPNKNNNVNIVLDGKLDELYWSEINFINDFHQAEPINNGMPTKNTEVRIFYDDQYLYFGVTLYDNPDKIVGKFSQYDDWYEGFDTNSDYFVIEIDSYHNHQTSYGFAINSKGVKADYKISNDDPEFIDDDWNQRWDAAVSKSNKGWFIECRIPFRILKYKDSKDMGLNFIRYIQRNNEYISWVVLPRELDGVVSQYGHLRNLDMSSNKYFSLKPYFIYGKTKFDNLYYKNDWIVSDNLFMINKSIPTPIHDYWGMDLKWDINNFYSIDLAINPDFGQIEQDPSEINLTAYETYFEEKRSFFTDGSSIFKTPINIFYSRRIGDDLKISINDTTYYYSTQLQLASKIVGRNNYGTSFGVISTKSEIDSLGSIYDHNNNYVSGLRLKQDILDGNSYFGIMGVTSSSFYSNTNIISLDGLVNLLDNRLTLDGQFIYSKYNKKIDDIELKRGTGSSIEASYKDRLSNLINNNYLDDRTFESWINIQFYDKNLNIEDIGYLYRNDLRRFNIGLSILREINNNNLKKHEFTIQSISGNNTNGVNVQNLSSFNMKFIFSNYWMFDFGVIHSLKHYDDRLYDYYNDQIFSELILKKPASNEFYFSFGNNPVMDFSFNATFNYYKNMLNDIGKSYLISSNYKFNDYFNFDFSYALNLNNERYHFLKVRTTSNSGNRNRNDIYQFTKSDNLEKYITIRASTNLENNISLQLYMEYFVNINDISDNQDDFTTLNATSSYGYPQYTAFNLDSNYNILYKTNYSSLTLNYIFQWEYQTGSNIYIVYSAFKEVSGRDFNNAHQLLGYKKKIDDIVEIYNDQSLFLKIDFWIDI
tara:strand:- start:2704 stop:5301 length:2598 start_codon:yes stop_codon:yes gene_type:complete